MKVIAIIVGLEFGLLLTALTFLSLIGYLVSGVLGYLFGLVLPIEHESLQVFFGYTIALLLVSVSVFVCIIFSNRFHKFFKWTVIILPASAGIIYLTAFKPIDKFNKVQQELENYESRHAKIPPNYLGYSNSIESKLNTLASSLDPTNNQYLGIFSENQEKVDSIIIDTLFISPDQHIGMCVFTMKKKDHFTAV